MDSNQQAGDQYSDDLDSITISVLRGLFETIANEMEEVLLKTAECTIINQALDATSAIFDTDGRTIAQAEALPCHLGTLIESVRAIIEEFPPNIAAEGDAYILNDAYCGGTHLPDFTVVAPVHFGDRVVAYTATMAHHTDVGGVAPGSTSTSAYDIHAEGLRVPAVRLVARTEVDEQLMKILVLNSRNRDALRGDLEAQLAACYVGRSRFREACDKWGVNTMLAASQILMDQAEEQTRRAISSLPDGAYSFTDYVDDDGVTDDPIEIVATVVIAGSEIRYDFTGSSGQVAGAINCTSASTLAALYYVTRVLADPTAPNNAGCYRPVTTILPKGSVVNAEYPAPVGARLVVFKRVASAALGALAQAAPERIPAANDGQSSLIYVGGGDLAGVEPLGLPFAGGMGARPGKDGIDMIDADITNAFNLPVETSEARLPIRILKLRLWQDSGGAGKFRGGLGYVASLKWLGSEALFTFRRDRHKFPPWGIAGGQDAPTCRYAIERASGEWIDIPSKASATMLEGDVLHVWTSGGGGHGDPMDRDSAAVLVDYLNGRISREAAEESYGVAITDECSVDPQRTADLRDRRLRQNAKKG